MFDYLIPALVVLCALGGLVVLLRARKNKKGES
jgi:hypothetical protein